MRDLRQADVELVLDAVRDLYALQDLPSFRARALAAVVRLVPGLRHGYVEAAPARRHYVMLIDPPDSIDPEIEAAAQRHLPEHPTFVNRARIAPGTASKISDFVSGRAFRRLGLYHEVYRPIGAEDLLGFEIPSASGADHFASFGVNRDRSGFSERDRQLLDLLSPHVAQAFTSAETVTLLLGAGTDPGAEAVVLDGRGRIDIASARARRLLADYFPPASFGELPEPLGAWVRGWGATLRNGDALARPLGPLTVGRATGISVSASCLRRHTGRGRCSSWPSASSHRRTRSGRWASRGARPRCFSPSPRGRRMPRSRPTSSSVVGPSRSTSRRSLTAWE
jgi:hypothetical protein